MIKNFNSTFRHILKNKQVILASLILGLAVVFIFSLEERGYVKASSQPAVQEDFVIESEENIIQPAEMEIEKRTQTDAIIYDKSMSEKVFCANDLVIASAIAEASIDGKLEVPILMYHYIETPGTTTLPWLYHSPAVFEAQLKTLSSNCYRSFFVSDIAQALEAKESLGPKPIAITFDDGYGDMYTEAYPLLKKYNFKGTMYVIVNALDTPGYLTKDQVREMAESGVVEIASHTFNHANLKQSNWNKAKYEIASSKIALEKIINRPVASFAYPYGFFTSRDEEFCRQAGYQSCASTYPGQVQTDDGRYSLYRLRPGYRVGPALIAWLELAGPKK